MDTPTTRLASHLAQLRSAVPAPPTHAWIPDAIHALIAALFARIFGRLEQLLAQWHAGTLPMPTIRESHPSPRAHHPRQRARRSRTRRPRARNARVRRATRPVPHATAPARTPPGQSRPRHTTTARAPPAPLPPALKPPHPGLHRHAHIITISKYLVALALPPPIRHHLPAPNGTPT